VLFASASLGAFAVAPGDTDAADVAIDVNPTGSGTLSVLVSETTAFNDVTYDLTTIQNSSGVLKVTATDDRGTALGWSVSIGATDFIKSDQSVGVDIGIGNLVLTPQTPTRVVGVGTTPTATTVQNPVVETPNTAQLWHAAKDEGDGQFELPLNGTLKVPAGTLVDTYTSTVTVSISVAP
jgi:hypothetical protein